MAKLTTRLNLMYRHNFNPSTCPEKGYAATTSDFHHYGLDKNSEGSMQATVNVHNDGKYVAEQLWETVSTLITFSSTPMKALLLSVGVTPEELSPFCRTFSSLEELRDECIAYLPRTFK